MEHKKKTRKEFEQHIVEKAWADPSFKEQLLASPKEVLEKELREIAPHFKFNENMNVHIIEEDNDNIYIVIPKNPKDIENDISSDKIVDIEGGSILVFALVAVLVAVVANTNAGVNVNVAGNTNVAGNVNAVGNANLTSNVNA